MSAIDEEAQIVRLAVKTAGREKIHAIVTPAEFAGKIANRHHLEQGDAVLLEQGELLRGRAPSAFRGQCSDVEFVDDLASHLNAGPRLVGPSESFRIQHHGRTMRALRLETRSRVGIKPVIAVDPES